MSAVAGDEITIGGELDISNSGKSAGSAGGRNVSNDSLGGGVINDDSGDRLFTNSDIGLGGSNLLVESENVEQAVVSDNALNYGSAGESIDSKALADNSHIITVSRGNDTATNKFGVDVSVKTINACFRLINRYVIFPKLRRNRGRLHVDLLSARSQ